MEHRRQFYRIFAVDVYGHELSIELVPYDADATDRGVESECITAACTAKLEAAIRARPAEWVWMHERWKTKPATA